MGESVGRQSDACNASSPPRRPASVVRTRATKLVPAPSANLLPNKSAVASTIAVLCLDLSSLTSDPIIHWQRQPIFACNNVVVGVARRILEYPSDDKIYARPSEEHGHTNWNFRAEDFWRKLTIIQRLDELLARFEANSKKAHLFLAVS